MELRLQQYFATHLFPSCSLHLYWIGAAKTMVKKKTQKCGNTASPCLDKPVLGQGGGGGEANPCLDPGWFSRIDEQWNTHTHTNTGTGTPDARQTGTT